MPNTPGTVADIIVMLRSHGVECALFGGWAEEVLDLRAARPHRDIDLVYLGDDLVSVDAAFAALGRRVVEVRGKRFKHKRACKFRGVLCEITLVQYGNDGPVTMFWGDVRFPWSEPFLESRKCSLCGQSISVVSVDNLGRYRRLRRLAEPHRWRDPLSRVP